MNLWGVALVAIAQLCIVNADSPDGSATDPSKLVYPVQLHQFNKRNFKIEKFIRDSNRFRNVSSIVLYQSDVPSSSMDIDEELQEITVPYGLIGKHRGDYAKVYKTFWKGITSKHKLRFDKSVVDCSIVMKSFETWPKAEVSMSTILPGVYEVVAEGLQDHSPKEHIWQLHSMPTLVVEEGRYFKFSLDFIQVREAKKRAGNRIDDPVKSYLNLEWPKDSDTLSLYGLPGVDELRETDVVDISFFQNVNRESQTFKLSHIKVKLQREAWNGDLGGPSFEAALSHDVSLADERINAAKCIADLYRVHIEDLRGLRFVTEKDDEESNPVTKIWGCIVQGPDECDTMKKLKQMAWPANLPNCPSIRMLSLKHNLTYWNSRCHNLNLRRLEPVAEPDSQNSIKQNNTIHSDLYREMRLFMKAAIDATHDPTDDSSLSENLNEVLNTSSTTDSTPHNDEGIEARGFSTISSSTEFHEEDFENNGEDLAKAQPKPIWSSLISSYRSRTEHVALIAGGLMLIAMAALIGVVLYKSCHSPSKARCWNTSIDSSVSGIELSQDSIVQIYSNTNDL